MKNKILVGVLAFSSLFFTLDNSFADLSVSKSTGDSVQLSWDKDSKSSFYQVFYGEQSSSSGKQTSETEATEGTSIQVSGLKAGTKYYFNLVGLDNSGVEVYKSPEVQFTTSSETSASSATSDTFSVTSAKLVSENILRLTFSKNLDSKSLDKTEVKIESSSNSSDQLTLKDVVSVDSDPKSIDLELSQTPTKGTEYKVVVLVVYDEKGNNIKFGVDSEAKFVGGQIDVENFTSNSLNSTSTNNTLNSAGPSEEEANKTSTNSGTSDKKVLTGVSGTAENTGKNVEKISEKKEDLPQTGPEMIVILILAMLVSGGILFVKSRKA